MYGLQIADLWPPMLKLSGDLQDFAAGRRDFPVAYISHLMARFYILAKEIYLADGDDADRTLSRILVRGAEAAVQAARQKLESIGQWPISMEDSFKGSVWRDGMA